MSKFRPGVRVVVIDGDTHELRKGVINSIYQDIEIAIVKFDDGNTEKVEFDCLGVEPEPTEPEKPTESVEKSEITITPDEFRNISMKVVAKLTEKTPLVGIALTVFSAELHRVLFFGEQEK